MAKGKVEGVKAGEMVKITYYGSNQHTDEVEVKPACDDKNGGRWYCATHQEGFQHNFDKDTHIETGDHRLFWLCFKHGAEQP